MLSDELITFIIALQHWTREIVDAFDTEVACEVRIKPKPTTWVPVHTTQTHAHVQLQQTFTLSLTLTDVPLIQSGALQAQHFSTDH